MSLRLFTAPQLSPLFDHFAEQLARNPLPPRDDEIIVVQSQGMRRWLTLQVADRFGCAGSLQMPFPATFVRELGQRLTRERAGRDESDPFSRDVLAWRVDALLRALPEGDEAFAPLRSYLRGSDDRGVDERARFGLAAQIAARLDDYQMFRADILGEWESGRDTPQELPHARWQAALWRRLCADAGDGALHLAARMRRAIEALAGGAPTNLPGRITVFGVSTLPPAFLELLAALARHAEVTVYCASLPADAPHPIASTFGGQSRQFIEGLVRQGGALTRLSPPPTRGTGLLASLQRELAEGGAGDSPIAIGADDPSLRIHDAHGRLRQVEIIRDQLLAALAADPSLRPHDLLLLVPDAAEWAPLVDAVFGVKSDDTPRIPYRIADRPIRRTEPAAEALARLLALEGGRFGRSEVFGFLAHPLARQAASLSEGEIESIEEAIDRANVRWGYDAESREALGLPRYEDASWRAGLDRLLLGTAVGRVDDLVLGVLPEAGDTTGDPETLATFADWVDDLAEALAGWREPRTLADWSATLAAAVDRFLLASEPGEEAMILALSATIRRLASMQAVARYESAVPFAVVRDWLEVQLDDDGFGSGFLQGGMTVAALKPMRSLPFRVIAVAGLDDGDFPRRERRSAFDLLEHDRPGDRDLRSDDRQLFLDLLLAAGDRLVLTHGGHAVSDNSPRAPSVVIDELLDHLDRRTGGEGRRLLVVEHPLQPFSARYFSPGLDPRLITYSKAHASAARASARPGDGDLPFITAPVAGAAAAPAPRLDVTLDTLTSCWMNPSRFFCTRVLRFTLPGDQAALSDEELFEPTYLEQGSVKAQMLAKALGGDRDAEREQRRLVADGALPPQALGVAWHGKLWGEVEEVLQKVPPNHTRGEPVPFTIDGDGWRLAGRIDGIRGGERYVVRAGKLSATHRIRAWVEHIAMCAARECGVDGLPESTVMVGKLDKKVGLLRFAKVHDARAILHGLVVAVRSGHDAPLPFFPQAAWEWSEVTYPPPKRGKPVAPGSPAEARSAATDAYHAEPGEYGSGGDVHDPYIALCFRGVDPMDTRWGDFERLVTTLFPVSPAGEVG